MQTPFVCCLLSAVDLVSDFGPAASRADGKRIPRQVHALHPTSSSCSREYCLVVCVPSFLSTHPSPSPRLSLDRISVAFSLSYARTCRSWGYSLGFCCLCLPCLALPLPESCRLQTLPRLRTQHTIARCNLKSVGHAMVRSNTQKQILWR